MHWAVAVVDELDGDEVVAGQLEHGQVPEPGLGDVSDHLVADGCVKAIDRSRSATRRPTCKVLIGASCRRGIAG
jgi:hypothetical protein